MSLSLNSALRWVLTVGMVAIGVAHFLRPEPFIAIMPEALPAKLALVYVSGAAEIAGGLGLVLPATRRYAAWGLILLYVAVFPANINQAVNHIPLDGNVVAQWKLWARLPFQLVLIAWAFWYTRPDRAGRT